MLRAAAFTVALIACLAWARAEEIEVIETKKIWDAGAHNAFTDLIRWHDRWWCSFREADGHVGDQPGKARIITSADGAKWEPAGLLQEDKVDLRDPKLSVTADGRLMVVMGGSMYAPGKVLTGRVPRVAFSKDGKEWSTPQPVLGDWDWLWRVTWHEGTAYGAAYNTNGADKTRERTLKLYSSKDGAAWSLVSQLDVPDQPNETTVRFLKDGRLLALIRREGGNAMGWVGTSTAPYKDWTFKETNMRLGGPNFIELPSGRIIAGTREYTDKEGRKMGLFWMDGAKLTPIVTLPSGGDCSYPGLVWHEGMLWVSYYSSHEGKTSIYLSKVKIPGGETAP